MVADVVDALAVARLTRLVTRDTLTAGARRFVIREAYLWAQPQRLRAWEGDVMTDPEDWPGLDGHGAPKAATLVTCDWCASVWVAFGVVVVRRVVPRVWRPVAWALAASEVAGLLAQR